MAMYLKNPSADNAVVLPDFLSITVQPQESIDISGYQKFQIQNSIDLVSALIEQRLILNDGLTDISSTEAVSIVRGVLPIRSTTPDGKIYTVNSARPLDAYYYVTGSGDDVINQIVGEGEALTYDIAPGQTVSVDAAFTEDVMFLGGMCNYDNAEAGCWLKGEIIAPPYHPFIALDGDGNMDRMGDGTFVPNTNGTGKWQIYPVEMVAFRFINRMPMAGNNRGIKVVGPEPSTLCKDYIVRVTIHNASSVKNLTAQVTLEMYRRHTL